MKAADRYLLRGFFAKTGLMLFLLGAVYLLSEALQNSRKLGEAGFTMGVLGKYLVLRIPGILGEMAPFAVLLGTLVLLGELSRHAELTALRAGGLSLARIARPLLLGGAIVAAATFVVQDRVADRLDFVGHRLLDRKAGEEQTGRWLGGGGVWFRDGPYLIGAARLARSGKELGGVRLYRIGDQGQLREVVDADRLVFRDGGWVLQQGVRVGLDDLAIGPSPPETLGLRARPGTLAELGRSPERMGLLRLWDYVGQLRRQGQPADALAFTLWQKITLPLACAVMVLVATPFVSLTPRSGGRVGRLLGGIAVGMAYHASNVLVEQVSVAGVLPPVLAAWLPVAGFTALGGLLLFRMR
ncbi:MAG TPA: LPS export ABC transporter permease LptG [Gammaproteobacteria bacterium]|nr:LPS export ABC transporter permease LptG [Gammaproteobacteria bacterium]